MFSRLPLQMAASNCEPMQIDYDDNESDISHSDSADDTGQQPIQYVETASLDLEAYANNYHGLAKIQRLEFIATRCPPLRVDALKMAIQYVKTRTCNVSTYNRLFKMLQESTASDTSGQMPQPDQNWVETTLKKAALKLEKLDNDLKNYRSNSIKESIRRGHDELGDHYLDCGDLQNALKCYSRSRDYCTTTKNTLAMCVNIVRVGILLQNWPTVSTYVAKAEATADFANSPGVATKIHCAAGLFELSQRKYKKAAKHFLSTNADHFQGADDILCPNNIAIYGGLCALATYDRQELLKNVINSPSFKQFFELEPNLREAANKFYESNYATCLSILAELKDILLLDIYLSSHVDRLYTMIRNRALVQYFSPYSSARMDTMAAAFNTTTSSLEEEVMHLILDGLIQARIDSHNKILFARDVDQRTVTFENAIRIGKEWQKRTKALILRAAILKSGLQVKSARPGNPISSAAAANSSSSASTTNQEVAP
ncbi:COP9 signalosome complex subunit 1, partial [Fragariocoptes setiger]